MVKKVAKYNAPNSKPTLEMAEDLQEFKHDDRNTLITGSHCYSQFSAMAVLAQTTLTVAAETHE